MKPQPFTIEVPQATLDDLSERLARTRWPDEATDAGWDYGSNLGYMRELVDYWQNKFDWRTQEKALNQFSHFRAKVNDFGLHFIHEKGKGPNPLPLILTHGWPDSFWRMLKLIPLLTDPASHGGDPADAFDVVVPSLPGYGFSDRPTKKGMTSERIADLWVRLMSDVLGYEKFAAHGGDIGSGVTEALAQNHPTSLVGIHLTDVPYTHLFTIKSDDLSAAEQKYLKDGMNWNQAEGAYAHIQSTRPQTLAYGLNDSPAGLAGWMVEKFRAWSDCDGEVEKRFSKDELLTNLMIYWATETINSANRHYAEWSEPTEKRVEVATALAIFPKDLVPAPREFAERFFNVQRWTEMPRGGHFAAREEPELLAEDIRAFFRKFR